MTLHRALISATEKGRGQEALARSLTPNHSEPDKEVRAMADVGQYTDSAFVRNENASGTGGPF